jgi:predicted NBD/HSP70 family sugar kinase
MRPTKGTNLEDIQTMNRELLIRHLINGGGTSRITLAKKTGLKSATVSNIINDFIDWGLVTETGSINNGVGRPVRGIRFRDERFRIIAVRLARHYVQTAVLDLVGNIVDSGQYKIDSKVGLSVIINNLVTVLKKILQTHKGMYFLGISIAIPGPWLKNDRKPAYFTGFRKWQDLDIGKIIEKEIRLRVFVEHDANIALMAEDRFLSWALSKQLVLWISLGQGVGSAIFSNGEILRGNIGIAGEIGHMSINADGISCECGNVGCLERYVSTMAILEKVRAKIKSAGSPPVRMSTIKDVIEAYKKKDKIAVGCINEMAMYIGHALASLSNILNPGVIILGDEIAASGEIFLEEVKKAFNSRVTAAVRETTEISLSDTKYPYFLGGVQVVIEGCLAIPNFFVNIKKKRYTL